MKNRKNFIYEFTYSCKQDTIKRDYCIIETGRGCSCLIASAQPGQIIYHKRPYLGQPLYEVNICLLKKSLISIYLILSYCQKMVYFIENWLSVCGEGERRSTIALATEWDLSRHQRPTWGREFDSKNNCLLIHHKDLGNRQTGDPFYFIILSFCFIYFLLLVLFMISNWILSVVTRFYSDPVNRDNIFFYYK